MFCPNCGQPVSAAPIRNNMNTGAPPSARKGGGFSTSSLLNIILAAVMVVEVVLVCFWQPGLLRNKPAAKPEVIVTESTPGNEVKDDLRYRDGSYRLEKTWQTEQIAGGILTEDARTLQNGDVTMTVAEGYLPGEVNAEIRKAPETVLYTAENVTVPLTVYEFNADGIKDDTFMTLEIPIEKPAGGDVGCGWYDEDSGTLWPVSFDYDEARGIASIHATHLSTYCGFPIQDENTKNAMIAYISNDELDRMFENMQGDKGLKNAAYCLVHSLEGEDDDWERGMQVANDLGTANMIVGSVVSAADAIGGLEQSMSIADGVGNSYMKNSIGTVGEIMNTNWGKAGSMPKWFRNYHGTAVEVPMTDKLKSVYPYNDINRIGNNITRMNIALSSFKIINHAINQDSTSAAWEAAQLAIDRTLNYLSSNGVPGLGTYMIGVGLFAYALSEVYSKALQGRKDVYINAYRKYYLDESADGGYRRGDEWVAVLSDIIKNSKSTKEASEKIDEELDRYTNQFWRTYGDVAYLVQVMTEDEKRAWGVAGEAGLKDADKRSISESYKRELVPVVQNTLATVNHRNREAQKEEFKKAYEEMRRQMNRRITIHISDGTPEREESPYAGCTVRFAGIHENPNVQNKQQYEAVLDSGGKAVITMTLLAHILANAGDVMQIVSKTEVDENGQPKVLGEHHFSMESPNPIDPYCVFNSGELEEVTKETEPEAEEAGDITPFLGQWSVIYYDPDGEPSMDYRLTITQGGITVPWDYKKYGLTGCDVKGNKMTLSYMSMIWTFTLLDHDHMLIECNKYHTWSGDEYTRVPPGKESEELRIDLRK